MADVYRYSVTMVDRGVSCVANIHYQTDVGQLGSEPEPQEVLDALDGIYSTSGTNLLKWRNLLQNGGKLVETRVYEEVLDPEATPPRGARNVYDLAGVGGALGTDSSPVELCAYISLQTAKLGRSFRGGFHGPPLFAPAAFGGTGLFDHAHDLYTGHVALKEVAITAHEDIIGSTDLRPVIYSRTRRKNGFSYTEHITTGRVNDQLRWLRRRSTAP